MIKNYHLFDKHDAILLAISGGPDSVALLNLLTQTNQIVNIYSELYLAHLNHLLRGEESEQDELFVRDIAGIHNLPIMVEQRNIRESSRIRKLSLEEAAREERYDFLGAAARQFNTRVIVVGHTADDNAETILHRIIRGTGITGLNGMRPKRRLFPSSTVELVRPLLSVWRDDIIAYLKKMNIPYRTDSTNLGIDTFRSRCRVELIPLLEKNYNIKVKQSLKRLGEISTQNSNFLHSEADLLYEKVLLHKRKETDTVFRDIGFDLALFKKTPEILQQIIMKKALVELGVPLKKFGHKQYKCLLALLKQERSSITRRINDYVTAEIKNNTLRLFRVKYHADLIPILEEIKLLVPGETSLKGFECTFTTEIREITGEFLEQYKRNKKRYEEVVDLEEIRMPLTVRTRRRGDRFFPLGSDSSKKLKDFFIDSKIAQKERDMIPIVTMQDQPIWVVGYRIDNRIRVSEKTEKLLIMKAEQHEK
ncbi:MAG: tRNA lysidine(34) synthetase TilS [Candidatus Scalindua sp.]|nr:tRNA lysidine(34) synthetase TilS [Candidatus Scalindua sp.]